MSQERVDNLFAGESWSAVYTAFKSISLKAYDFDTLREALLVYIKQTYPDKYNDFIASSEFVAILDLVAYLGHSLSYRLDMNTRENFLDLAERKESILRIAKSMGYNKTRPINGRGFMKITSVQTTEDVYDSNGVSLANRLVNWNDANEVDWYENFITIINSALDTNTKIENPKSSLQISSVAHDIYEVNEDMTNKSVVYKFKSNIAGSNRKFEAVRVGFDGDSVIEMEPDSTKKFTIINRNDNLGPGSDRTGFFVFSKLGELTSQVFNYTTEITNRVQTIADDNISNSDVWVQKLNSSGSIISNVAKVDNTTRETAIYNSLKNGSGDIVHVRSTIKNGVELQYPDGIFGNVAFGNYRVWYRKVDNAAFSVNRSSISNQVITIPYLDSAGVTHRLSVTLSSTRDFSENFEAETYTSIRRVAPRSYYSQDRMVNAQDYNVLPLSLGTNVVRKVKAVNTSFAGNSRYFEMDDVLGHHSNVVVNSDDGSLFVDDDVVTTKLRFNRNNGNSINFIRNEISKVIGHNSLANKYYIDARLGDTERNGMDPNVIVNTETTPNTFSNIDIVIDPTDLKRIEIQTNADGEGGADPHPSEILMPGDFIKIRTDSHNFYWTRIYGSVSSGGGVSNSSYFITTIIPEEYTSGESWTIVEIVKGYRSRFEDTEIIDIKNNGVDILTRFYIKYEFNSAEDRWQWRAVDEKPTNGIFVELYYNPTERSSEAEYTVRFTGKNVIFESENDVTFHYGNEEKVIDVETNLSVQDRIKFDFYSETETETNTTNICELSPHNISLGISKVHDLVETDTELNFKLDYGKATGAPTNLEYIDGYGTHHLKSERAKFILMDNSYDDIYDITEYVDNSKYNTIIGQDGCWDLEAKLDKESDDLANALITSEHVYRTDVCETSSQYTHYGYYDADSMLGTVGNVGNVGNVSSSSAYISSSCSLTIQDLINPANTGTERGQGFQGEPSKAYFESAIADNRFIIVDDEYANPEYSSESDYPEYKTREELIDIGIQTMYSYNGNESYTFVVKQDYQDEIRAKAEELGYEIDSLAFEQYLENEYKSDFNGEKFYWVQYAFADIIFKTNKDLEHENIKVTYEGNDNMVSEIRRNHWTLTKTPCMEEDDHWNYRITFWTEDPTGHDLITISEIIESDVGSLYDIMDAGYSVRAEAEVSLYKTLNVTVPKFATSSGYIYDKYITSKGYVDYSKVRVSTLDQNNNPYGIINAIGGRYVVLETDDDGNVKISDTAVVTYDPSVISNDKIEWYYNPESNMWHKFPEEMGCPPMQTVPGKNYKVTPGISYVDNTLPRYVWEHFADNDKRIDPTTSNIVDVYVLTADYTRKVEQWRKSGFKGIIPSSPNNYELKKVMSQLKDKEIISDHVSYVPVKFKTLFGEYADQENQAVFKVVKKSGTTYTDSEIKSAVSATVNEYFKIENWDFGDMFYFSELAAYLHSKLGEYISSVVITPKYSGNEFTNLLSISSEPNEIFLSVTTSNDVKIIERITDSELSGE